VSAERSPAAAVALLIVFAVVIRYVPSTASVDARPDDCQRTGMNLPLVERCLALHPDDVDLLMDAGDAYAAARQGERAERAYRRALMIDPRDRELRRRLDDLRTPPAAPPQ
jgi:hypothetical protein